MSDDVYRRLAKRLDEIPNGFEPTESGIELRLLEKMFDPDEAELACGMRLTAESAEDIAARARRVAGESLERLQGMVRKGLIREGEGENGPVFGLIPFVVGIYEGQLARMDEEMASLFEQYMQETRGGSMARGEPAVHRVIPVDEAIPVELEVFPYERASELIGAARSWGVRDCICRVQRNRLGKGCEHEIENCLIFAPVPNAFEGSELTRAITKDESLAILRRAADAGLVHSSMNQRDQIFYICNCCTCCCGVLRGVAEFDVPTAVARSDFQTVVDGETCTGCGACLERCQFGALTMPGEVTVVDHVRCVGCGVCVPSCPVEALSLERRPEGEVPEIPADRRAWMLERARKRGMAPSDVF